jgi:hypothetical protein
MAPSMMIMHTRGDAYTLIMTAYASTLQAIRLMLIMVALRRVSPECSSMENKTKNK